MVTGVSRHYGERRGTKKRSAWPCDFQRRGREDTSVEGGGKRYHSMRAEADARGV
jgi:hypothetical protein